MILSILGTLLLIATVVIPGSFLMKATMDNIVPRAGFVVGSVVSTVVGGAFQLGLGLLLMHLVNFLG